MNLRTVVFFAVFAGGCAPFQVVRGPESCELARDFSSDFDGPMRANTFYYDSGFRGVGLLKSKKGLFLSVVWVSSGAVAADVEEGTKLEVALDDGSILELKVFKTAPRIVGANPAGIFSQWITDSALDSQQFDSLVKHGVRSLRTTVGGTQIMQKVLDDPRARLQTLAICLAQHSG